MNGLFLIVIGLLVGLVFILASLIQFQQNKRFSLKRQNASQRVELMNARFLRRVLGGGLSLMFRDSLTGFRRSPNLLLSISALLHYMLYKKERKLVSLQQEIKLIKNYLYLRKNAGGAELNFDVAQKNEVAGKWMTPPLLFPVIAAFVENGWQDKQLSSGVNIRLDIFGNNLQVNLCQSSCNSHPESRLKTEKRITVFKQLLRAAYPEQPPMVITETKGELSITLWVLLQTVHSKLPQAA